MLLSAAPALASANVSCLIDDAFIRLELEAIAGRDGPIVQVQSGDIEIKPAAMKLAKPKLAFEMKHIVQQWTLGDDLRLQVEIGDETAREAVNVAIVARLDKAKEKYLGRYVLKVSRSGESKELKGRIKECIAG